MRLDRRIPVSFALAVAACLWALLAAPAFAQEEFTISASPSPATAVDDITLTITGVASCPLIANVEVGTGSIEVLLSSSCPFLPPDEEPFVLETTLDPLDPGTYELALVTGVGDVLASGGLVVLEETPCLPSENVLCLLDRRFSVEVEFRTQQGATGRGNAVSLTSDSGYFWFFEADNVEMVVKAVDACGDPFNRFWIFAAGLTNVEVDMVVTDTQSGEVRTYTNDLGVPFAPIQDTDAFATCP